MLRLAGENTALINTVFHLHDARLSLDLCRCNFPEPSEIVMIHRVNKCPDESDFDARFFFPSFLSLETTWHTWTRST